MSVAIRGSLLLYLFPVGVFFFFFFLIISLVVYCQEMQVRKKGELANLIDSKL